MGWFFSLDDCKLKPFNISVSVGQKQYNMLVTQSYLSVQIERLTIHGGTREFQLQSDRPYLRSLDAKKGITWKIIKGQEIVTKNPQAFHDILREIETHIKIAEKKPFDI